MAASVTPAGINAANPAMTELYAVNPTSARIEIDNSIFDPGQPDFIRNPMSDWLRLPRDYSRAFHRELQMRLVNSQAPTGAITRPVASTS